MNRVGNYEWDKLISEIKRRIPGLMEEMWVDPVYQSIGKITNNMKDEHAFFFAGGPIVFAYMTAFAAKAGFALDFEERKVIVPSSGRVQVRWFTSGEMLGDQLPPSLFRMTGELRTLRQGKLSVEEDFAYAHGEFAKCVRLHYMRVRQAFSVAAFIADDENDLPFPIAELATFTPGELKSIPAEKVRRTHTKDEWLHAGMPSHWD